VAFITKLIFEDVYYKPHLNNQYESQYILHTIRILVLLFSVRIQNKNKIADYFITWHRDKIFRYIK